MDFGESNSVNMKAIIGVAFAVAMGFLCNILSCVLWKNWLPFLIVITYVLAPLPNLLCERCGGDDLEGGNKRFKDIGFFLTGFLVISGFGIPAVMAHSKVIKIEALILALAGGLIVYIAILVYIHVFHKKSSEFD